MLEQVFEELEYEECSEDTCIMRIQEMLQVENVFNLQIIGEGTDSQLNLKWITLDEKKNETDVCLGCGTFQLNDKVRRLVEKLVGKIVVEENKEDQKEEELKRQKEEEQKKRKEEELSKIKDEERIKIENEKKIKERQTNYSYTFRSFGIINTFSYKIPTATFSKILYSNELMIPNDLKVKE